MKTPEKLVAGDRFHHVDGNSRVTLTVTGDPVPGSHGTVRVPVSVRDPEYPRRGDRRFRRHPTTVRP